MVYQWCWRCGKKVWMVGRDEWAPTHAQLATLDAHFLSKIVQISSGGSSADVEQVRIVKHTWATQRSSVLRKAVADNGWPRPEGCGYEMHRVALFGRICSVCGLPWRTPKARYCVNCGNKDKGSAEAAPRSAV